MLIQSARLHGCKITHQQDIFFNQYAFKRPFEAHGCNHVEYSDKAESIETRLLGVSKYLVVYGQA